MPPPDPDETPMRRPVKFTIKSEVVLFMHGTKAEVEEKARELAAYDVMSQGSVEDDHVEEIEVQDP